MLCDSTFDLAALILFLFCFGMPLCSFLLIVLIFLYFFPSWTVSNGYVCGRKKTSNLRCGLCFAAKSMADNFLVGDFYKPPYDAQISALLLMSVQRLPHVGSPSSSDGDVLVILSHGNQLESFPVITLPTLPL